MARCLLAFRQILERLVKICITLGVKLTQLKIKHQLVSILITNNRKEIMCGDGSGIIFKLKND